MADPIASDDARAAILTRMEAAAKAAGRDPASVRLIAVSKQQPEDRVRKVLGQGQLWFGENRVQEGLARWKPLKVEYPDVRVRLIGPLQTNKARDAVGFFDAIDSLDRDRLAEALAEAMVKTGKRPDVLIQVNTGEEPQKAGIAPLEADDFIRRARETFALPVRGLMCIPPEGEEPAMHFALLAKIAARNGLAELSMGMSGDFETAIRFGATNRRTAHERTAPK